MKKSLAVFLGSLTLSLGVLALNGGTVGSSVSQKETDSITGGTCYVENPNAAFVTVCSSVCGTSLVRPRIKDTSGSSAAGVVCRSNDNCTYGGVGSTTCVCD
jgi:hypothetical protein